MYMNAYMYVYISRPAVWDKSESLSSLDLVCCILVCITSMSRVLLGRAVARELVNKVGGFY